jgi:hypothetical protein
MMQNAAKTALVSSVRIQVAFGKLRNFRKSHRGGASSVHLFLMF